MHLKLSEVAKVLGTSWRHTHDPLVCGVSTDTRCLSSGELFFALRGERFDGHAYLSEAEQKGAVAAVVTRASSGVSLPQIEVPDTRKALGLLAAHWHQLCGASTIGITGSVGKTTVKTLLACLLEPHVCVTQGNFNNDIGVPLTLFSESPDDKFAVIEMGANAAGEIGYLASLARPRVGVLTAIAPAHVKGFGSVEGIARAKSELFASLPEDGAAVTTVDVAKWRAVRDAIGQRRLKRVALAREPGADLWIEQTNVKDDVWHVKTGGCLQIDFQLPLLGQHNLQNALLALAAASQMEVDLTEAVQRWQNLKPVAGRMEKLPGLRGSTLINDAYNASPASVRAAIDWLATQPGRRILVLGDMAELGNEASRYHQEMGNYASQQGIDQLLGIGELSEAAVMGFSGNAEHFANADALCAYLQQHLTRGDVVLFKGSRVMALERVITHLREKEQEEGL
ncbi:MAG: UDP-N-acetylmuramoyl-tripeptide--D-alanyl-D-alanine ligase [Gammaproteobacteria bacterium]|nr:MAG: UDP-N-acetylmuramoyl-tripeptide--D-alanyl-D-alanine ligase [Gammaproteobacteria bacterium]